MTTCYKITQGEGGPALYVHDVSELADAFTVWVSDSEEVYHVQRVTLTEKEYKAIMRNDFDGF